MANIIPFLCVDLPRLFYLNRNSYFECLSRTHWLAHSWARSLVRHYPQQTACSFFARTAHMRLSRCWLREWHSVRRIRINLAYNVSPAMRKLQCDEIHNSYAAPFSFIRSAVRKCSRISLNRNVRSACNVQFTGEWSNFWNDVNLARRGRWLLLLWLAGIFFHTHRWAAAVVAAAIDIIDAVVATVVVVVVFSIQCSRWSFMLIESP